MRRAVVNLEQCQPERCEGGICLARKKCPLRSLWQEEPYETPVLVGRCNGCSKCLTACPVRAITLI